MSNSEFFEAKPSAAKPWVIYRDGILCAEVEKQVSTTMVIKQLRKLHPASEFKVFYHGPSVSHCGPGGTAL